MLLVSEVRKIELVTAKVNQLVNELLSQGRWDEAYSVLSGILQKQPNDPEAQFQLGSFCYTAGRFQEAERCLKQASTGPNGAEAQYVLGLALLKLSRPAEAVGAFREACEKQAGYALGHLHWGLALAAMASWRGALGQFKQAIKLNPDLQIAYYQAGVAAYKVQAYNEALEFFTHACKTDQLFAEAWTALAMTQAAMDDTQGALTSFEMAWQADPSQSATKRSWAAMLMRIGRYDEATKQYLDAMNINTQLLEARDRSLIYNDWGVNLFQQGKLDESAEKLLQSVGVDPTFLEARINLGLVKTAMQEFEQAHEEFAKVLEMAPENPEAHMQLGINAFLTGHYIDAKKHLVFAFNKGLDVPNLRLWLGFSHMSLREFDKAEECFNKIISEFPDSAIALDALGATLAFQDRHIEAVQKFQACIQKRPDYALAHLHLARSYEASGRGSEAMNEYRMAVTKDPKCFAPEKELIEELLKHSQYELVQSKTRKLLELLPTDTESYLSLARAYKGQGKADEAMEVLNALSANDPNCGAAYVMQGQLYLSQGLLLDADEKFRVASQLYEGDIILYYGWGKTLGLLGLHELALEKFEKANEIDPFDADTYEAWGATLKILGRYQEAAEVYRKAAEYI